MSLVASVLEAAGIATVALSVMPDISAHLAAPRTLLVPHGLGEPVGPASDARTQRHVVRSALDFALDGAVRTPAVRELGPADER